MAIYRRQYRPHQGALCPERTRFWILARYALVDALRSRALLAYVFLTQLPVLAAAIAIYLAHNPAARALLGFLKLTGFIEIDANFFRHVLATQCFFGLILAAWVGPSLIASDLAHGALPLYLSRPISRTEYVLGKSAVLTTLLSGVTWFPGILLYLLNWALADLGWGIAQWHIALALLAGSASWILSMTLLSLALSAWIRWRLAASVLLFGIYFVSAGLGEAVAVVLKVSWGRMFSLGHSFEVIWAQLFRTPFQARGVPPLAAWMTLLGLIILSLGMLNLRLRGREVTR